MLMPILDKLVKDELANRVGVLEDYFDADCIFYYGPFFLAIESIFRGFIEDLKNANSNRKKLVIFLNSPGGEAEVVEKLVYMIRHHYAEVYFVVPDEAMSAGTIFCMSGDKIFMDYSSSLGPIDPQIYTNGHWVPALGYLDQIEKVVKKSARGEKLTEADFSILSAQDLAWLSKLEQAKELTITLLKNWLVEYKFKDWNVTTDQKKDRAKEIANKLSDNKRWHSHARKIGIKTLTDEIKLKIEDYSEDTELRSKIRAYNDLLTDYLKRHDHRSFLHSRRYF